MGGIFGAFGKLGTDVLGFLLPLQPKGRSRRRKGDNVMHPAGASDSVRAIKQAWMLESDVRCAIYLPCAGLLSLFFDVLDSRSTARWLGTCLVVGDVPWLLADDRLMSVEMAWKWLREGLEMAL